MMPFLFQFALSILMILSVVDKRHNANAEVDNPDSDSVNAFWAKFIPADVGLLVKWTQFTTILVYVIFADSSLQDVASAVNLFPRVSQVQEGEKTRRMVLSSILRGTQGILATIAVLLLVITSSTVIDIILNFTAVGFISKLDNVAFELAKYGRFGPQIEAEAKKIEKTPLPRFIYQKQKHVRYLWTVFTIGIFLISCMLFVIASQKHPVKWTTQMLRVQFPEFEGMNSLEMNSGCYKINKDSKGWDNRHEYNNIEKNRENISFGFCHEDRRWVLFEGDNNSTPFPSTPCNTAEELIHSSKTDTYDIASLFDAPWYSSNGESITVYFFEEKNGLNCDLSLNDGHCDPAFNSAEYQYDGGDCCADTCTNPSCGFGGLTSIFGTTSNYGDGYSNCRDPSMVPITIRFDNIFGSNTADITDYLHSFKKPDDKYNIYDHDKYLEDHSNKEPIAPPLFLDCNGKIVISIVIDESMENETETVMVKDGANCILTVRNSTSDTEEFKDKTPILHIKYTIFHGDEASIKQNPIVIASEQTSAQDTINFNVVPNCYLKKLMDYFDITTLYTGSTPANEAIDWLMDDNSGNSQCESPNFIERYALAVLSFSAPVISGNFELSMPVSMSGTIVNNTYEYDPNDNDNDNNSWRSSAQQCVWPQITCKEGAIVSINLISNEKLTHEGSIATEIGLLKNLTTLILDANDFTGTFPSAIDLMIKLTSLSLAGNSFTGTFPNEIGVLTGLTYLSLAGNGFTGSLPSEIGSLLELSSLILSENDFTGTLPTEIGVLNSLTHLSLGNNLKVKLNHDTNIQNINLRSLLVLTL